MYELVAAISSVKTISDITTFLLKAKVGSEVAQKAIELQGTISTLYDAIMKAQLQNHALIDENKHLKQQLAEAENWGEETKKYQLVQIEDGIFAYMMKPDQNYDDDPDYWLCANCYQKKQKSMLQRTGKEMKGHIYTCANCNARIVTFNIPSPMNVEGG